MSKNTRTLLSAAFAAAIVAAPSAGFAQTPDKAQGTAGEQHNQEKSEMDRTREGAGTSSGGMTGSTSGSGSSSSTSGTAGYTDANPAPPPNAQQNAPRPNN